MQVLLGVRSTVLGVIEQARSNKYFLLSSMKWCMLLKIASMQVAEEFAGSASGYYCAAWC